MKTSWKEARHFENFLQKKLHQGDSLLLQARMILQPELRLTLRSQKKTYEVVNAYGRKKVRAEIEAMHRTMFADPEQDFVQKIFRLFH